MWTKVDLFTVHDIKIDIDLYDRNLKVFFVNPENLKGEILLFSTLSYRKLQTNAIHFFLTHLKKTRFIPKDIVHVICCYIFIYNYGTQGNINISG